MHDLGVPFYFPHRLDFRGRAYPQPVWLQPQGPDIARSMLRFAEPEVMTPGGWDALMTYGDELFGSAVARTSLSDAARSGRIGVVYDDPLSNLWWTEAKKPCQFLAW